MAKHGIELRTLRDCIQFLEWLKRDDGMKSSVAKELPSRYGDYYNQVSVTASLPAPFSEFLDNVSTFYYKLANTVKPRNYAGKSAQDVTGALSECIPKFLAALHFLLYNVNEKLEAVGGGKWKHMYPGWENTWFGWWRDHGGALQGYLRSSGLYQLQLMPGGFGPGEVTYGYQDAYYDGYPYGESMVPDLEKILNKKNGHNYFRDVFVTTVKSDSGTSKVNTGNVLALVKLFCETVNTNQDGEKLKEALEEGIKTQNKCVDWSQLSEHCRELESQLRKFFNDKAFSHTGQVPKGNSLNTEKFMGETATWFRKNLSAVQSNVKNISTQYPADNTTWLNKLRPFATDNIFPYGLIFGDKRHGTLGDSWETLPPKWNDTILMLKRDNGGLDKLRKLLEGEECKARKASGPAASAKPAAANLAPPSRTSDAPGSAGHPTTVSHMVLSGTRATGGGTDPQNKNNQVQRHQQPSSHVSPDTNTVGSPNQNNGQSEGQSTVLRSESSHAPAISGKNGGRGTTGMTGDRSPQGSHGTGFRASSPPQDSKRQQVAEGAPQPVAPPPASPPSTPAAPASPGNPGGGSGSPNGGGPQPSEQHPSPSASPTGAPSPATPVSCGGRSQGGQAASSDAGPTGGKSHDSPGGVPTVQQPAQPRDLSVKSPGAASSAAPCTSSVSGSGDLGSTSGSGRGIGQKAQRNGDAGTTASAGPSSSSGGGGDGAGDGTLGSTPKQCPGTSVYLGYSGSEFCQGRPTIRARTPAKGNTTLSTDALGNVWEEAQKRVHGKKPQNHLRDNVQAHDTSSSQTISVRHPSPQPSRPFAGGHHITRRQPIIPGNTRFSQEYKAYDLTMPMPEVTGESLLNQTKEEEDILLRKQRRKAYDLVQGKRHDALTRALDPVTKDVEKVIKQNTDFRNYLLNGTVTKGVRMESGPFYGVAVKNHPDPLPVSAAIGIPIGYPLKQPTAGKTPPKFFANAKNIVLPPNKRPLKRPVIAQPIPTTHFDDNYISKMLEVGGGEIKSLPKHFPSTDVPEDPRLKRFPTIPLDGEPIADLNAQSLHTPPVDLEPAPPPPAIELEIKNAYYPELLYQIEERRSMPLPSVAVPAAIPDDTYLGVPPEGPPLATIKDLAVFSDPYQCNNPWDAATPSTSITRPYIFPHPASDHLPPPQTVREMLYWFVGLNQYGLIGFITEYVEGILKGYNTDALDVRREPFTVDASHVTAKLAEACLYAATVIYRIKRRDDYTTYKDFHFNSVYSQLHYSADPAGLLCQLRDYVYACHHQLEFLKAQCKRDKQSGGWKSHEYGSDLNPPSPLQTFLTDGWDSTFETHLFDPCNLCLKSRVRMGFKKEDLPSSQQTGKTLSSILTPSCGGSDPLLTLASYLNCLTRRTPRTTGELVSFFHNLGNSLHDMYLDTLSPLGSALSESHLDCPDWDRLDGTGLQAVRGIRGTESLIYKFNSVHDKDHPRTLSTLVGCGDDSSNCHPRMLPITYRAYALYSQKFSHTYLSWAVYLPDRLWESLEKLYYDLQKHFGSGKCTSLHLCSTTLPLLYTHGFTPPEVGSQPKLTCSDVIEKMKEIVNGQPIASLMTAMDNFLYGIREPFIFTLMTLWSIAFLIFASTMLYRIDVLHIRSHLIRTKASHLIDVKALLTEGRKMQSLYDVDYFDEDPIGQISF